jgi:hypothetical protein
VRSRGKTNRFIHSNFHCHRARGVQSPLHRLGTDFDPKPLNLRQELVPAIGVAQARTPIRFGGPDIGPPIMPGPPGA